MLRLDESSRPPLQPLVDHFHVSKADIIRHLITHSTDTDFPTSWHMRAAERRAQQVWPSRTSNRT
jgi:hypothetical protein